MILLGDVVLVASPAQHTYSMMSQFCKMHHTPLTHWLCNKPLSHMHDLGQLSCDLGIFQILSDCRSSSFVNFVVVLHIGLSVVVHARTQKSAEIFEVHNFSHAQARSRPDSAAIVVITGPQQALSRACVLTQWSSWYWPQSKCDHNLQRLAWSFCKCLTMSGRW